MWVCVVYVWVVCACVCVARGLSSARGAYRVHNTEDTLSKASAAVSGSFFFQGKILPSPNLRTNLCASWHIPLCPCPHWHPSHDCLPLASIVVSPEGPVSKWVTLLHCASQGICIPVTLGDMHVCDPMRKREKDIEKQQKKQKQKPGW